MKNKSTAESRPIVYGSIATRLAALRDLVAITDGCGCEACFATGVAARARIAVLESW